MRKGAILLAALALAATGCCSYGPGDGGYPTAPHATPVQVASRGGPILSPLQLVTVTWANDPLRATDEAFGDWVVGSDWFATTGREYGLDGGSDLKVELTADAPATITDFGVDGQLTTWIKDGTLPSPTPQTLYLVYFPATTTVTAPNQDAISCAVAAAYHSESQSTEPPFAYAVVPTCPDAVAGTVASEVQTAASHEILEAATDPFPSSQPAFQLPQTNPWALATGSAGGELGDLCFPLSEVDGEFTVSLGWSNTAAAAGGDPCVPSSESAPYFSASPSLQSVMLAPGASTKVPLIGWATGPMSPWTIGLSPPWPTDTLQGETASLSAKTLENDGVVQLQIDVPAGAAAGSQATIVVYSLAARQPSFVNHESYWPIEVTVE